MIESPTGLPLEVVAERVTLRQWIPFDAPSLSALITRNLDHLRPWMPWVAYEPLSDADRAALFETWRPRGSRGAMWFFGVFLDGQPIGGTGLHRRRGPKGLEIGYWIDKDHTNNGYATEVAGALTSTAFTLPGIDFVEIHHDKANVASRRVPEHLGFTFLGETPDEVTAPGEVGIDCGWRMQVDDWHD